MRIKAVLKAAALGCSLFASVAAAAEFNSKQVDAIFARGRPCRRMAFIAMASRVQI